MLSTPHSRKVFELLFLLARDELSLNSSIHSPLTIFGPRIKGPQNFLTLEPGILLEGGRKLFFILVAFKAMKESRVIFLRLFLFINFIFFTGKMAIFTTEDYSLQEVKKVLDAIEKVTRESMSEDRGKLREIVLTESELNSYLAYSIEVDKEEVMKELKLKLFPRNRLEGKVFLDLSLQKIPFFLKPKMVFYFRAELQVKNRKARIIINDLFIEGQRIQPKLLDFIIYMVSKVEGTKPSSLEDWYDLPFGIKEIKTDKRKVTFYY